MADGGNRLAASVRRSTDTKGLVVVGVDVTDIGSDPPDLVSMAQQAELRVGIRPTDVLVDESSVNLPFIEVLGQWAVAVPAPALRPRRTGQTRLGPRPGVGGADLREPGARPPGSMAYHSRPRPVCAAHEGQAPEPAVRFIGSGSEARKARRAPAPSS